MKTNVNEMDIKTRKRNKEKYEKHDKDNVSSNKKNKKEREINRVTREKIYKHSVFFLGKENVKIRTTFKCNFMCKDIDASACNVYFNFHHRTVTYTQRFR